MASRLQDEMELDAHSLVGASVQGGTMNKPCKSYAVDLSAYFDGELEPDEQRRIEDHLAECKDCQDVIQKLRRLRGALHSLARPPRRHGSILHELQARLQDEERSESLSDPKRAS